eukprot:2664608-Pleurochrysis_carterae.AAC.2
MYVCVRARSANAFVRVHARARASGRVSQTAQACVRCLGVQELACECKRVWLSERVTARVLLVDAGAAWLRGIMVCLSAECWRLLYGFEGKMRASSAGKRARAPPFFWREKGAGSTLFWREKGAGSTLFLASLSPIRAELHGGSRLGLAIGGILLGL